MDLEDGRLTPIDDCEYVLTLDFTIKMLNIHERSVQAFFKEMWLWIVLHVSSKNLHVTVLIACQVAISVSLPPFSTPLHRYKCGMPVIIEGETGVGKTALLEMLSKLWNHALVLEWKRQYRDLLDFMRLKLEDISTDVSDKYQVSQLACMHVFCAKELFSQKIGKMAHVLGVCSSIVFT